MVICMKKWRNSELWSNKYENNEFEVVVGRKVMIWSHKVSPLVSFYSCTFCAHLIKLWGIKWSRFSTENQFNQSNRLCALRQNGDVLRWRDTLLSTRTVIKKNTRIWLVALVLETSVLFAWKDVTAALLLSFVIHIDPYCFMNLLKLSLLLLQTRCSQTVHFKPLQFICLAAISAQMTVLSLRSVSQPFNTGSSSYTLLMMVWYLWDVEQGNVLKRSGQIYLSVW